MLAVQQADRSGPRPPPAKPAVFHFCRGSGGRGASQHQRETSCASWPLWKQGKRMSADGGWALRNWAKVHESTRCRTARGLVICALESCLFNPWETDPFATWWAQSIQAVPLILPGRVALKGTFLKRPSKVEARFWRSSGVWTKGIRQGESTNKVCYRKIFALGHAASAGSCRSIWPKRLWECCMPDTAMRKKLHFEARHEVPHPNYLPCVCCRFLLTSVLASKLVQSILSPLSSLSSWVLCQSLCQCCAWLNNTHLASIQCHVGHVSHFLCLARYPRVVSFSVPRPSLCFDWGSGFLTCGIWLRQEAALGNAKT